MKTIYKPRPQRSQSNKNVATLWGITTLIVLLLMSPNLLAANGACQASTNSTSVYTDFRAKYPFHFQTVGLAEYPDNSCFPCGWRCLVCAQGDGSGFGSVREPDSRIINLSSARHRVGC